MGRTGKPNFRLVSTSRTSKVNKKLASAMNTAQENEQLVSKPVARLNSGLVGEDTESDNEPYPGSVTTVLKQQLTKTTMLPLRTISSVPILEKAV